MDASSARCTAATRRARRRATISSARWRRRMPIPTPMDGRPRRRSSRPTSTRSVRPPSRATVPRRRPPRRRRRRPRRPRRRRRCTSRLAGVPSPVTSLILATGSWFGQPLTLSLTRRPAAAVRIGLAVRGDDDAAFSLSVAAIVASLPSGGGRRRSASRRERVRLERVRSGALARECVGRRCARRSRAPTACPRCRRRRRGGGVRERSVRRHLPLPQRQRVRRRRPGR